MHHPRLRLFLAVALTVPLAACHAPVDAQALVPHVTMTPAVIDAPVGAAVVRTQSTLANAVAPTAVAMRGIVQAVVPSPVGIQHSLVSPAAVALIVRWEISSAANYTRRLTHPAWPGGASGITWGIGYDGGYQTVRDINDAWAAHPSVDRLAGTAGVAGDRAKAALPGYADIITPYPLAYAVFATVSLPAYRASAHDTFGPRYFDALPPDAQGALVSLVYNRGASMVGDRNVEKRAIRDICIPVADVHCIADQLRDMCRIWAGAPNGAGLCHRRNDEADLAESNA